MLKGALIGCGARGKSHASGFKDSPSVRLASLADVNLEAAQKLDAEFNLGASLYTDHREMLAQEKPDMAAIVLWPHLHLPVFRDCVEAGVKAVLCEKPMAPTWEDCQEMGRIAEETGTLLVFSHQRRYARGNQLAARLIAEGLLGQLQHMHLFSPPNTLDCGTHTFDQAMSLMGEAKAKWVLGAVDATQPISWFGVEADFTSAGQVVFENGVRASLQFGGPDMDLWGGLRITGEKGFLEIIWDGEIKRIVVYDNPSCQLPPFEVEKDEDLMKSYVEDAAACLQSGGEPRTSWKRALQAAEVIFAFYQSARLRARVELPLTGPIGNPFHDMLAQGELDRARALGAPSH